jgi:hypothetical protein
VVRPDHPCADTIFSDTVAAYAQLPEELKQELHGLQGKFCFSKKGADLDASRKNYTGASDSCNTSEEAASSSQSTRYMGCAGSGSEVDAWLQQAAGPGVGLQAGAESASEAPGARPTTGPDGSTPTPTPTWVCSEHPLVTQHPVTLQRNIFASASHTTSVVGRGRAASEALLQRLSDQVEREQFHYRHQYRDHDLVIFDNRGK